MLPWLQTNLGSIVVVLVLSASMSTLSSLVLTSSSSITLDLIKPMAKGKLDDEKRSLIVLRTFVGVFLIISVIIALNKNALISDLMGYSWGALAGAFLAPFLYGLFWKGVTKAAVWASFISGVGITVAHLILSNGPLFGHSFKFPTGLPINLASPINAGAFAMVFGLILVPIVSKITPKLNKKVVDHAFEKMPVDKMASVDADAN